MAKNTETARIAGLSEELLQALESQRRLGREAYPPTLRRLAELCDGSPPLELAIKAAGKKPFSEKAALDVAKGQPKDDAPAYFKEDKQLIQDLKLAGLAERALKVLESQRRLDGDAYPPPLRRLVELCDMKASDARVPGIVGHPVLADRLVVAVMKGKKPSLDAPVFLRDDLSSVFPSLALFALNVARAGAVRAFTATQLAGKLAAPLKKPVADALKRDRIEHQDLPPDLAWVPGAKGEPLFFHIEDLHPTGRPRTVTTSHDAPAKPHVSPPTSNGVPSPSKPDFSEAFHEAFERLDRHNRSTNFVKLSDLRRALPAFGRDEFDAGLRRLRNEARYSLNSHEGLHGSLTPEDREAGIHEVSSFYIYASRR